MPEIATATSSPITAKALKITRIEPETRWAGFGLKEFWDYRELVYFFIWRDVKVRYKQTALGIAWAVLQPVLTMLIFSLFFGRLGKMPSDGIPYPVFAFTALVPWTFFGSGVTMSSNSLVTSANMIKKVYFPRLAIPIASICAGLVDLAVAFLVLLGLMGLYHLAPTARVLWLLPFIALALVTAIGVGLWLSALNVQYRDIRYVVPFLVQMWMFATPIAYSSSLVPAAWRPLYALNPLVGAVEGFRWALLGTNTAPGLMALASSFGAAVLLITGAAYFRRMERTFADVV